MELVNSIIKDLCGAELLPVIISSYPADYVCFQHLWKTQYYCFCLNRRYNLSPAAYYLPHILSTTYFLIHTNCNIKVTVRSCSKSCSNGQLAKIVIKHQPRHQQLQLYSKFNVVTIQHKKRIVALVRLVFLEIANVPFRTDFANIVTYTEHALLNSIAIVCYQVILALKFYKFSQMLISHQRQQRE